MIISLEVFDLLRKLIKSDNDSATRDVSLLCCLFSGEEVTLNFATEQDRQIPMNTPLSILGAIQTPAAAKLFGMCDGQVLVDRLLFISPSPIRPTPAEIITDFTQVFHEMYSSHEAGNSTKTEWLYQIKIACTVDSYLMRNLSLRLVPCFARAGTRSHLAFRVYKI